MGAVGTKKKSNTENLGVEAINASKEEGLFSYKILLVGNEGVGKASLFQSYFDSNSRNSFSSPKTGFTLFWGSSTVSIKKKKINLRISYTDTGSVGSFQSVNRAHDLYKETDAFLILFDSTKKSELQSIDRWHKILPNESPLVVVGTKVDLNPFLLSQPWDYARVLLFAYKSNSDFPILPSDVIYIIILKLLAVADQFISQKEAKDLAEKLEAPIIYTSSKENYNIKECLKTIASLVAGNKRTPK